MPADRVPSISLAAGLTLRDWLRPWLATCLKWPNDVLGPDLKKLAGILSEAVGSSSGRIRGVVVGVGLNVSWPNGAPPDGLRTPAASLRDYGVDASFETLRATLPIWASGLRDWRDRLTGSGQAALADAYNAAMCAVKRPVRLKSFESDHSVGYIEGVSPAGKLRFRRADSGEIVDIESGELELQDTSVSMPAGD